MASRRKLTPQQKAAETRRRNAAVAEAKRIERNRQRRKAYAEQKSEALRKVVRGWGRALDKARDLGGAEDWAAFRRAKARKDAIVARMGRDKWRRMLATVSEQAEESYDADFEES